MSLGAEIRGERRQAGTTNPHERVLPFKGLGHRGNQRWFKLN